MQVLPQLYETDPVAYMAQRFGITETVTGASFGIMFRIYTLALITIIVALGIQAKGDIAMHDLPRNVLIFFSGAIALVTYTAYWIFAARTTITPQDITQTFVWNKRMLLGEIAYVKYVRIPYLSWLIAPRAYIRNPQGKFTFIYGSTLELQAIFAKMAALTQKKV